MTKSKRQKMLKYHCILLENFARYCYRYDPSYHRTGIENTMRRALLLLGEDNKILILRPNKVTASAMVS